MLPFPPRALDRPYLDINPTGTVPLFIDGDTRMTESAAICQYLAARNGPSPLDVAAHEPAFGCYLNHLHFGEATLTFPQTLVLRYGHFETPARRQPQVAQDYARWFLARLRTLDSTLSGHEFVCSDRFTAADISIGYALLLARHLGLNERFTTAVQAYWRRLEDRHGYQRALRAQEAAAIAQGISIVPSPDLR